MEADSDGEVAPNVPSTLTERRRAQKQLFERWLVSDAAQETLKPKTRNLDSNKDEADEILSIQSLLAKQGTRIVKKPRQYQMELFERAQKQNTIAVLDTGSGKTLIAVLLLRWIIDQELERRATGEAPKISFFLVASVTLVYQQFSVLEANLDHKVARVCGADNVDNWHKDRWVKLFSECKVIVATADILHHCLAHGFISIEQISLLIFDEAHHAKRNHAYARIVKDFYIATEESRRPRIFGMTASPVDAKVDFAQATGELESLLHSTIATTTDMSLTDAIKKPTEQVLCYPSLPREGFESELLKSIKARFTDIKIFEGIYETARDISRHLGRWCADLYLADALSTRKLHKYELDTERKCYYRAQASGDQVSELDEKVALLRQAVAFAGTEHAKYNQIGPQDLSSKVVGLQKFLNYQFERPTHHRCIVFVQTRHTARLLDAVFKKIGTQYTRSDFLIGSNNPNIDEENFSFRQQVMTLVRFRKGEVNCLFATSVAEEGLDVPDCNLVIRFDMYSSMIQYVQSRGRARQQNSKFIHMIEAGNSLHTQLLQDVRFQEMALKRFCQALPEDRRLEGDNDNLEQLMMKEMTLRVYTEPSTGAKLTYGNALVYLANFVSAIPTESEEMMHPTYIVNSHGSKFIAEVVLPGNAPVRSATGKIRTKKTLAKRSAAFEACIELRKKEYLDENLLPTYQKKLPALRLALMAVNMDNKHQYTMRTKPSVWKDSRGSLPSELYLTMVDFAQALDRPHQPIAFLTRTEMPAFPQFPVFPNDGRATQVVATKICKRIAVDDALLERLSRFTFCVFRDVFSKKYEYSPTDLSYWLGPIREGSLDLVLLEEICTTNDLKWSPAMPAEALIGRFLIDPWDGSRKFCSKSICPDLKPLDPVPDNEVAKAKWDANILDYSISLYKKAREKATWTADQPVMEAEKVLARRNMLAPANVKEVKQRTRAYLCPEPLRISLLPPAIATTCFVWPAIIHRFESYLIALEAGQVIGVACEPGMALAAVTKDSDNSGEHENQERVNFQSGMGENYERLEFIGDTFLKTATTISVFIRYPHDSEAEFHIKRAQMLCNQNLFNVAQKLELSEYIRSRAFSRRVWYPEGLKLLEGLGANVEAGSRVAMHALGEKTIADVCEAFIGAAFMSHDRPYERWQPQHWQNAIRAVTKLVNNPDHAMTDWSGYSTGYDKPTYQTGEVSASHRDLAQKVELEHAYHFKYPRLLRSAFNHPSQSGYDKVPDYQRLEFLGDALLDMASISHLFYRFPDKDPQWLTEHKMAMVSNKFLGAVCVNIGFHKHLRYAQSSLTHQITEYATELHEARRVAGGARDYWTTVSDPPKCLPDIVESYVGAIFIDSDFDYGEVRRFFETHVRWYFEDMSIYDSFANNHPCTHLHTLLQTTYGCQDYRLMAKELPQMDATASTDVVAVVIVHKTIVAHSKGKSARYGRLRAAQKAIEAVSGLAPYEFRSKFGCDCVAKSDGPHGDEPVVASVVADCSI